MERPGGGAPLNQGRWPSHFQHEPKGEGVTSPLCMYVISEGSHFGAPGSRNWPPMQDRLKLTKGDKTGQLVGD